MSDFRRIIRAQRVILKAAETLDALAESFEECATLDGEWPAGSEEAQAECVDLLEQASNLRQLLKGGE